MSHKGTIAFVHPLKNQGVLTGATDDSVVFWTPFNGKVIDIISCSITINKDLPEQDEQLDEHIEFEQSIHLDESLKRPSERMNEIQRKFLIISIPTTPCFAIKERVWSN
jgi:hypothetical protein